MIAAGDGRGAGWAAAALAVSLVYLVSQLVVVVLGRKPFLPWMLTGSTRAGQIAALVFYSALSSFCLLGVVLAS